MNIFCLDTKIPRNAQYHCDRHVVKMVVEYAQLLSTAHRVIDGKETIELDPAGRAHIKYLLDGESIEFAINSSGRWKATIRDPVCYDLTHKNHPCAIWVRQSNNNYNWLYCLFQTLSEEYTHRYGRVHKTWKDHSEAISRPPVGIPVGPLTTMPQCMPEEYRGSNVVLAYRLYYLNEKADLLRYTNREVPPWITANDHLLQV